MIYQVAVNEWINFGDISHLTIDQGTIRVTLNGQAIGKRIKPHSMQEFLDFWSTYARTTRLTFISHQERMDSYYQTTVKPKEEAAAARRAEVEAKTEEMEALPPKAEREEILNEVPTLNSKEYKEAERLVNEAFASVPAGTPIEEVTKEPGVQEAMQLIALSKAVASQRENAAAVAAGRSVITHDEAQEVLDEHKVEEQPVAGAPAPEELTTPFTSDGNTPSTEDALADLAKATEVEETE